MSILKNPIGNNGNSETQSEVWAHDVCRIWSTEKDGNVSLYDLTCCLCGTGATNRSFDCCNETKDKGESQQTSQRHHFSGLTRCAAVGCQVVFHPTCAVLATRLKKNVCIPGLSLAKERFQDLELSNQYTLSLSEIRRTENVNRNLQKGEEKSYIVPIAFCGLHNPKREESFYGCPPCCEGLQEFIRIPYQYYEM